MEPRIESCFHQIRCSAAGGFGPVVDSVLPLEEIRAAHERLEAGEQLGKIVLTI